MSAWSNSTRRQRLPKNWSVLAHQVKVRDGYRCQIRDTGCTTTATEVDHIQPGDDHHLANLQAVCSSCHKRKTNRESQQARGVGALRRRPPVRHPGLIDGVGGDPLDPPAGSPLA